MKKFGLFFLIISGLVFYTINSNSSLLKEKFEVYHDVDASSNNVATAGHDFITVSSNSEHPQFACVKLENCYYCQLNQVKE